MLLTEFNRPINSWCFLELAVLILLLHKDSKDIGPEIVSEKSLSDEILETTLHHYNILKELQITVMQHVKTTNIKNIKNIKLTIGAK